MTELKLTTEDGRTLVMVAKDGKDGVDGLNGVDGKDGKDGVNGLNGVDGLDGKDGVDGVDGIDGLNGKDGINGKDGSPDSPTDIKNKLESLKGAKRLDVSAIKGITELKKEIKNAESNLLWVNNGAVKSVTGSAVDNTDPQNPVINGGGGGVSDWGDIGGTLSDQTDLQDALDLKADISSLGAVALSNDYTDLDNLPTLGTASAQDVGYFATSAQGALADSALQSGDNISELVNDAGYITGGSFVPYTGATADVDLGTYNFRSNDVHVNGDFRNYNDLINDMGYIQTSDKRGYGVEGITDKTLNYIKIGANGWAENGGMRVLTTGVFAVYSVDGWKDIPLNILLVDDDTQGLVYEQQPVGTNDYLEIMNGASTFHLGLNGLPITNAYKTVMGCMGAPTIVGGYVLS